MKREAKRTVHTYEITATQEVAMDHTPSVEFEVTTDRLTGQVEDVLTGYIKWDGCSNIKFADGHHHFCGKNDVAQFGEMLAAMYEMAVEWGCDEE